MAESYLFSFVNNFILKHPMICVEYIKSEDLGAENVLVAEAKGDMATVWGKGKMSEAKFQNNVKSWVFLDISL